MWEITMKLFNCLTRKSTVQAQADDSNERAEAMVRLELALDRSRRATAKLSELVDAVNEANDNLVEGGDGRAQITKLNNVVADLMQIQYELRVTNAVNAYAYAATSR